MGLVRGLAMFLGEEVAFRGWAMGKRYCRGLKMAECMRDLLKIGEDEGGGGGSVLLRRSKW
jgi:hypothetical protein